MQQSDLDLLHLVPPHHLQALVKSRRLPPSPRIQNIDTPAGPSSIAITEIAQHLFDPAAISDALQALDERENLILRELVLCGGRANSRDLALYLANSGLLGHGKKLEADPVPLPYSGQVTAEHTPGAPQYPVPHPHGVFELAVRHLLLLGLLFWGRQTNFGGRDYASGVYDGVLIVPQTVMEVVKAASENLPLTEDLPAGAGAQVSLGEGLYRLQRTLYLYWSLVAAMRDGLSLMNSGSLSRYALRQVVEHLGSKNQSEHIRAEHEVPHLLFTRLLLMKLGLLRERQGALRAAPAGEFFALPLLERARRCYRIWLEATFWNEMIHIPEVIIRPGPNPLDPAHEEVVQSRQTVVERLLHEQPEEWCEFSTFVARTKLYAPYLLFPRRYGARADRYSMGSNPYGWDFRLRRGWLTHREGWHLVEGGFIRALLSGPLHWLGLVETNNEDAPTAFRLAASSLLVMGDASLAVEEPPAGRLIVQPNFELVALAPVSEALLISLDRFAERTGLERIAQYRLTKASVTRAIQLELHAETILQLLEQASGAEIPQNVQYSLMEWERQARRIELWRGAVLLEVDDPALLDTLFADEQTRPLLGRRLTPMLLEVPRHQLPELQEALWQRGYLPALVPASLYDHPLEDVSLPLCEPQWRLHDDGLLQPLYTVLNLYLVAELERISELDTATGWRRITPASLQLASDVGISLESVVRFLERYGEGGVPTSFLMRLKLWGGGYDGQSSIQVERTPLLALSDQVLQDLRADEELRELLGAEISQQHRLVHVHQDKLERVIELLRARGFEVRQEDKSQGC